MLMEVKPYNSLRVLHFILSHPGRRRINEDSVFPEHVNGHLARTYVVCDGVGGGNRGDLASQMVSRRIGQILGEADEVSEEIIESAILQSENELKEYTEDFPESRGMATTVVGFHPVDRKSGWVYWVGDSRLYHLRDGEILFKTKDHSLVQMMVDKGDLTEAEAQSSTSKNIILQAISDGRKEAEPEFHYLEDIRPGDRILLITDGILEGCPESQLAALYKADSKEATSTIRSMCEEHSSDNFSMIAIEIVGKK